MAKIKKDDLENLSDLQVREIYLMRNDELNLLPQNIREYVVSDGNNLTQRLMRVKSLLQQIMIERFLIKTK